MKFFYSPNSCAIGIHIILEEIGADYESVGISLADKDQLRPEFQALNPKGKVPTLIRDDGSTLTEFQTIAFWLARMTPEAGLYPDGLEDQTRLMELLDFIVASVHMRGFTFISVAPKFTPNQEAQKDLQAHGRAQADLGFARLAEILGDKDHLLGDFSLADAALFYLTHWALRADVPMPAAIAAHHNRMSDRPAVKRALAAEGMPELRAES